MSLHTDATASPTASITSDTRRALEETCVDEDESSVVSLTESSVRSGVSSQSSHKSIVKQHICLSGDDSRATFMIYGDEVLIEASKASSSTQSLPYSNKVTLRPVLKFDWEHQYYVGNLVAVHCSLNYVAYALKGNSGGVLRISSRTSSERILVRGFQGRIVDVSFANIISQVLIAAVDESGTFHVYDINVASDGKLESRLLLKVIGRHGNSDYQRVYWCPCFGDEMAPASDEDVDETSRLLVVVNNTTVEVWNVSAVMRQFGSSTRQITSDQVTSGRVVVDSHTEAIVDIALSPDGSMLATASLDGRVKFFSIDMELCSPPSCVRSWLPHSGRPVSAIFFLDNRRQSEAEVWKFLVTLADNGSELKLWDCTSWACLQTITMSPTLSVPQQFQLVPCVKAQLDPTACYLVLADIKRKVMCVIYLHHDSDADSVRAVSVTEFIVAHPCLSLAVYDVSTQCLQCSPDRAADPSHQGVCRHQESDIDNVDKVVILKLYAIQSKMLQELFVYFKPDSSDAFMTTSLFTAGSLFDHDRLSDVSSLSDRLSSPVPDKLTVSAVGLATTTTSTTTPTSSLINTDRVPETAMYMSDSSSFTYVSSLEVRGSGEATSVSPLTASLEVRGSGEATSVSPLTASLEVRGSGEATSVSPLTASLEVRGSGEATSVSPLTASLEVRGSGKATSVSPLTASLEVRGSGEATSVSPLTASLEVRGSGEATSVSPLTASLEVRGSGEATSVSPLTASLGQQLDQPSSPTLTPLSSTELHHHSLLSDSTVRESVEGPSHNVSQSLQLEGVAESVDRSLQSETEGVDEALVKTSIVVSSSEFADRTGDFVYTDVDKADRGTLDTSSSVYSGAVCTTDDALRKMQVHEHDRGDVPFTRESPTCDSLHDGKKSEDVVLASPSQRSECLEEEVCPETGKRGGKCDLVDVDNNHLRCRSTEIELCQPPDELADTAAATKAAVGGDLMRFTESPVDDSSILLPRKVNKSRDQNQDTSLLDVGDNNDIGDRAMVESFDDVYRTNLCKLSTSATDLNSLLSDSELVDTSCHESLGIPRHLLATANWSADAENRNNIEIAAVDDDTVVRKIGAAGPRSPNELTPHLVDQRTTTSRGCVSSEQIRAKRSAEDEQDPAQDDDIEQSLAIEELHGPIENILRLLSEQSQTIKQLNSEMHNNVDITDSALVELPDKLHSVVSTVTAAVTQHQSINISAADETRRSVVNDIEQVDSKRCTELAYSLTDTVERCLSHQLVDALRQHMHLSLVPCVDELLKPTVEQLRRDFSVKLTAVDSILRDSLCQLVQTQVPVTVSEAAGSVLEIAVNNACRDILIPTFDRCCQSVLQQLRTTFDEGFEQLTRQLVLRHTEISRPSTTSDIEEVVHQLQSIVDALQRAEDQRSPVYQQFDSLTNSMHDNSAKMHDTMNVILDRAMTRLHESLVASVQQVIKQEVTNALNVQSAFVGEQVTASLRSRAATPVHVSNKAKQEAECISLLRQGHVNAAFEKALSLTDLYCLMSVCAASCPAEVFGYDTSTCPLKQPVLLSLIQQLSVDLNSDTELKTEYLEEAVLRLDRNNRFTAEHSPILLRQLCRNIDTALLSSTHSATCRRHMKLVNLAAQSLLNARH